MTNLERLQQIETLRRQLATFSTIDPKISNVSMQAMVEVAYIMAEQDTNTVKQSSLVDALPVTHASVSRAVTYWSDHKYQGSTGHGLLQTSQDPENRRFTLLRLSPRGSMFVRSLFSSGE